MAGECPGYGDFFQKFIRLEAFFSGKLGDDVGVKGIGPVGHQDFEPQGSCQGREVHRQALRPLPHDESFPHRFSRGKPWNVQKREKVPPRFFYIFFHV